MANAVNLNIKIDEELKKGVDQICEELGLSVTAAITVYLKKLVREKRIPFDVSVDPFYSESNIRYLENIMRDVREGRAHFAEHDLIEVD